MAREQGYAVGVPGDAGEPQRVITDTGAVLAVAGAAKPETTNGMDTCLRQAIREAQ